MSNESLLLAHFVFDNLDLYSLPRYVRRLHCVDRDPGSTSQAAGYRYGSLDCSSIASRAGLSNVIRHLVPCPTRLFEA